MAKQPPINTEDKNTEDKKRSAFSLPAENLKQPYLWFQWKAIPTSIPSGKHNDQSIKLISSASMMCHVGCDTSTV